MPVLLELDTQSPRFLQQPREAPQIPCAFWLQAHLIWQVAPEVVDQCCCPARAPLRGKQHFPALVELVGLRLNLQQEPLELLAGQLQIVRLLTLLGPQVAALRLQLLKGQHLHRQCQLQHR